MVLELTQNYGRNSSSKKSPPNPMDMDMAFLFADR
jgi:hypothetical protein